MGVVASLQGADSLSVEPGREATCELSLSNTGTIVEQFSIMMLGDGADWIRSDPPVVSMFPGAQQTVTLHFAPPRDSTIQAGEVPFAVKIIPSNEPEESVTEEGTISVGSFNDFGAELLPRHPTGRIGGRQRLAVDSRGNLPVPVALAAIDASDALKFRFRPGMFTAAPGAAHFVRIRILPKKRFFRGSTQVKPYQVTVSPEGERPIILDGQFRQNAVFPKWLFGLIGLLIAAAQSAASNAQKTASGASSAASGAQNAANGAQSAANKALVAVGQKPVTTTTSTTTTTTTVPTTATTVPPPVTSPTDGRIEAVAAPGQTAVSQAPAVGSGTTMTITDLIIQNISGGAGTARIERVSPNQPTQDLLVENLSNLSDQEYRFDTPIIFSHDQRLQLRVDCAGTRSACDVGVYYTGPVTQPASATTTTIP